MHHLPGDLREGHEHEVPSVRLRMGYGQGRPGDMLTADEDDIEINRPGSPPLLDRSIPAEHSLNLEHGGKNLTGGERRFKARGRVQELRLRGGCKLRGIKGRRPEEPRYPAEGTQTGGEEVEGPGKGLGRSAKIPPEGDADGAGCHGAGNCSTPLDPVEQRWPPKGSFNFTPEHGRVTAMKEIVARELAARVKNGEVIGVGTGTTVDAALIEIERRVRSERLQLKVVPTSLQSAWRCQEIGLDVLYPGYRGSLAWGFDGADEVNDRLWLIKGKGGALLQEKILAARCGHFIVIVDESKIVTRLGEKTAVPVEVVPEALAIVEQALVRFNPAAVTLRSGTGKHGPVITERGNVILDVQLNEITADTEAELKQIVGVVESGIFTNFATEVLVGSTAGVRTMRR